MSTRTESGSRSHLCSELMVICHLEAWTRRVLKPVSPNQKAPAQQLLMWGALRSTPARRQHGNL